MTGFRISLLLSLAAMLSTACAANQTVRGQDSAAVDSLTTAAGLAVDGACDEFERGRSVITFRWTPAERANQQLIQTTMYRGGEFEAITELPDDASSFEWDGGEPGINYYWRVVSLTGGEAYESEVARAETPICPVDERHDTIR